MLVASASAFGYGLLGGGGGGYGGGGYGGGLGGYGGGYPGMNRNELSAVLKFQNLIWKKIRRKFEKVYNTQLQKKVVRGHTNDIKINL